VLDKDKFFINRKDLQMLRIKRLLSVQSLFLACLSALLFAQSEESVVADTGVIAPVVDTLAVVDSSIVAVDTMAIAAVDSSVVAVDTVAIAAVDSSVVAVDTVAIAVVDSSVASVDTAAIAAVDSSATADVPAEETVEAPVVKDITPDEPVVPIETVIPVEPVVPVETVIPIETVIPVEPVTPPVEAPAVPVVPIVPGTASDPTSKPKIAVYVTGDLDPVETRALGTYILDALVKSERYIAIERTEEFLAQIDREHVKQRSGAIDDEQIISLGKQSGVPFICVTDVTKAFGGNQVSVRILDVETAKIVAVGVTEGNLKSINDLRDIASAVVDVMFNVAPPPERRVRIGGRVAYNNSFVTGYSYTVRSYDRETSMRIDDDHHNEIGKGSGFEVGGVMTFRISSKILVETGVNLIWRNPVTISDIVKIDEYAITVPALLRFNIGSSPFYAHGGWHIELPFGAKEEKMGEKAVEFKERSAADVGVIVGGGVRFSKSLSADLRIIGGLITFDGMPNHRMFQAALGGSLMF
jgi:hypothetical protein